MRVGSLAVFPLKSARGAVVDSIEVERRGPAGDRRWMIVDANGRLVTQREMPALARLIPQPTTAGLRLSFDGHTVDVERPEPDAQRIPASIWRDSLLLPEAPAAAPWLSRAFGAPLRLVHQPEDALRQVSDEWGEAGDEVSLADGFPLLVATTASLAAVEEAVGGTLGMGRFRPNLVIEGADAWEEDTWAVVRAGPVELELVKPCARCTVPTVDQQRGVFTGDEPLATLRRIRMSADARVPGVLFGWNAIPRRLGTIRVGDPVEVPATRPAWPVRQGTRRVPLPLCGEGLGERE